MNQDVKVIHQDAKIGEGVEIGPFTHIHGDVEIGEGTWIGSNVTIMDGARIGKNCRIFPGAVISAVPQDLKYKGEITYAVIGNNTTVRECATINKGTAARGKTRIGNNCLLMAYSHIGHDCEIENNVIIGNSTQIAGEVEIDDFAILSGQIGVHQFSKIGKHTMVQGMSGIGKDVPPFVIAGRNPLVYAGLNSVGLKRRGFSSETINSILDIYRILYQSGLNTTNAVKEIEDKIPESTEKTEILNFIKESKRGIIKGLLNS
ncbi:acyl-ACP--UDP-N-acetylglucosamine O-acyltransferase [Bacteroidales bacterium]|nr:acyl-ACP--UDP-N-acetylglucosamine O-acyltransferase [Bacteroidales bacterium]